MQVPTSIVNPLLSSLENETLTFLGKGILQTKLSELLTEKTSLSSKIARKTLKAVQQTKKSQTRDAILINLLNEPSSQVKESLKKILEIIKKNFFKEFLQSVDNKGKKIHSSICEIINLFEEEQLSLNNLSTDPLFSTYQALQDCHQYNLLPKLAEKYTKILNHHPLSLSVPFDKDFTLLFQQLNKFGNKNFDIDEKTKLAKTIFHLIDNSLKKQVPLYHETDLCEFLSQAQNLKQNVGKDILDYFLTFAKQNSCISINEMTRALQLLNMAYQEEAFFNSSKNWKDHCGNWEQLFDFLEASLIINGTNSFFLEENISDRLNRFTNDPTVTKPLCKDDINLIDRQYQSVNDFCEKNQKFSFQELMTQAHHVRTKAKEKPLSENERLELIAIGRLAIRLHFGINLYSTQILALLGVLIGGEKRQAQIKTGEGKSIIVTLWAFVMAMECRGVDIITSARYLAIRDQKKFAPFFEKCGITTSHICHDNQRPSHFKAQVLYGPVFDFEFAWMKDQLFGSALYEERMQIPYVSRNFDAVCIDESDNLLIDTAANGARLSFPAEDSYDWIYASILSFVKLNFTENSSDFPPKNIGPQLREFICQQVPQEQQKKYQEISNKQIKTWVSSAHRALFNLKENIDYVVKQNRDKTKKTKESEVQIIDLQTGRISEKSRWSKGVHEFLEIKHDVTVEQESIVPISLSHAVFYQMYRTITAVTGTAEEAQTAHIYKIITFHVPPHQPSIRKDLPIIFVENTKNYYDQILTTAQNYLKWRRPLLILCETIQDSQDLEQQMQLRKIPCQLLNEIQEEQEETVIGCAGLPGKITIATNAAGRGTDILLDPESLQNGGLHVLATFYPNSEREEQQAIGRAGRQGQPGSSQIILNQESHKIKKILSSFKDDLSPEIALLLYRKDIENQQIAQHLTRANLERFLSEKTTLFFDSFRTWINQVNQKTFLDIQSQRLCKLKLTSDKENILKSSHQLTEKEYLLAQEYKELLSSKEPSWMHWKAFLKKVIERMNHKIIKEWSLHFFQPVTEEITTPTKKEFVIKNEIEEKFNSHRPNWEKYLDPSGLGVFTYLEELTILLIIPTSSKLKNQQ